MKRTLIVFAAKLETSVHSYRPLLDELRKEPGLDEASAEFLLFDQVTHRIGLRRLTSFADDLAAKINESWVANGGFEEVILFGHSIGGLLMREAYLKAWGNSPEPLFAWAGAVRRIVLLGAPNRGLPTRHWHHRLFHRLAQLFLWYIHFTYLDFMQGSAFITNLRLRWIRHFRARPSGSHALPQVLQLRGIEDDVVLEEDSADVLAFPEGQQVPISGADHGTIALLPVERGKGKEAVLTAEGRVRYILLRNAILRGPESLGLAATKSEASQPDPASSRVVFILHGIRARNIEGWLERLEEDILKRDAATTTVRPGYGYFSALQFVLPSVRRRNIRFLQNEYTQRLAANPDAKFCFIGHSNGTFMLGESLKQIPAMRFERVVLAGCVLPRDFFEPEKPVWNQVGAARSDGACFDWPVGILCRVLRSTLRMKDVGTSGYDGFSGSLVKDYRYHPGGHGRMFTDENVRSIIDFVLGDSAAAPPSHMLDEHPVFGFVARLTPKVVGVALVTLVLLPVFPGFAISWLVWEACIVASVTVLAGVLDSL